MNTYPKNKGFAPIILVIAVFLVGFAGYAMIKGINSPVRETRTILPTTATSSMEIVEEIVESSSVIEKVEKKDVCSPSSTNYAKAYLSTTGFQASDETAVWGCVISCGEDQKLFVSKGNGTWPDGNPKGSFACVDRSQPDVPSSNVSND